MKQFKTTDVINYFNYLISNKTCYDKDESFFLEHMEFDLAKSILQDFGETYAKRLALVLLRVLDE